MLSARHSGPRKLQFPLQIRLPVTCPLFWLCRYKLSARTILLDSTYKLFCVTEKVIRIPQLPNRKYSVGGRPTPCLMYKHGRVTAFSLLLLAPNFLRGLLDEKRWVAKRFSHSMNMKNRWKEGRGRIAGWPGLQGESRRDPIKALLMVLCPGRELFTSGNILGLLKNKANKAFPPKFS